MANCLSILARSVWITWCLSAVPAAAEVVDRVVAAIGLEAITASRVDEEIRLSALFNRQSPDFSAASRQATLERIIEQTLIRREMELLRMQEISDAEAARFLEGIIREAYFTEQEFWDAARAAALRESVIRERARFFAALARFVQLRFSSAVAVSEAEIEQAYETEVVQRWKQLGADPPSLDDVRGGLEASLAERKAGEALDDWLLEARRRASVNVFWEEKQ